MNPIIKSVTGFANVRLAGWYATALIWKRKQIIISDRPFAIEKIAQKEALSFSQKNDMPYLGTVPLDLIMTVFPVKEKWYPALVSSHELYPLIKSGKRHLGASTPEKAEKIANTIISNMLPISIQPCIPSIGVSMSKLRGVSSIPQEFVFLPEISPKKKV